MKIKQINGKVNMFFFIGIGSFITQILYGINLYLGITSVLIMFTYIYLHINRKFIAITIYYLIFSLPISYISIVGDNLHHIFSWYNIFTIIFCILLIKNRIKRIDKRVLILLLLYIVILFINNLWNYNDLIDLMQILTVIIPCFCFMMSKNSIFFDKSREYAEALFYVINGTSVFIIFQYLLKIKMNYTIGYISYFANRNTYDGWFKGYSVLSIFLGIGIVIGVIRIIEKFKIGYILGTIISFIAIIINSSRSGLFASILTIGIIFIKLFKRITNKKINLIIIISCLSIISLFYFIQNRTINFFNDNGRYETYNVAVKTITKNTKNFLFGIGLSEKGYDFMSPHNFIIQSFLEMGLIASLILFFLIILFVYKTNKSNYFPIFLVIFIGNMFITSFFANTYLLLCFIIILLDKDDKNNISSNQYLRKI